jgi:2-polyprenyl-3-methyl-5-hydroxy-6-metoxy-1,4-benzoquinol methylase
MTLIQTVREQYEQLPYPPRDPRHEMRQLHKPIASELGLANHVIWHGHRRMDSAFRALDAGCGTGDNTIFMAIQLQHAGAQVVAIDLSEASLAITRERAAARGLTNITLIRGRLEELPSLGLETFDYAVSNGVLHHLPSPALGLAAIRDVLKPDGGAHIMVYGQHGRSATYQLQTLFKLIAPESLSADQRLRIVRETLSALPPTHWRELARNGQPREVLQDADIFDLYLHSVDRAYTVPEIHAWLSETGMRLVRWLLPHLYSPELYSARLDVSSLSRQERETAAELLNSRMAKHSFFITRDGSQAPPPASLDDETAIPTWLVHDVDGLIRSQLDTKRELELEAEGIQYRFLLDPFRRAFLKLVDGKRPLGTIMADLEARLPKMPPAERAEKWRNLYQGLEMFNVLGFFPAR